MKSVPVLAVLVHFIAATIGSNTSVAASLTVASTLCDDDCYVQNGQMFDVQAVPGKNKSGITINSLKTHLYQGSRTSTTVEVYTKQDSYIGFVRNPKVWTKIASHTFDNVDDFSLVEIPSSSFNQSVHIEPGLTQGFYVTTNDDYKTLLYHHHFVGDINKVFDSEFHTDEDYHSYPISAQNEHLIIYDGPGITDKFGPQTAPGVWNGELFYTLEK